MFSNIICGFILLHFNCDSEVPVVGTGYTSVGNKLYLNISNYMCTKLFISHNIAVYTKIRSILYYSTVSVNSGDYIFITRH